MHLLLQWTGFDGVSILNLASFPVTSGMFEHYSQKTVSCAQTARFLLTENCTIWYNEKANGGLYPHAFRPAGRLKLGGSLYFMDDLKNPVSAAEDLGYEVAHVGFNMPDADSALELANALNHAFGFPVKVGNSSIFASPEIEINKYMGRGIHGHLAVRTNSIALAAADLEKKGYTLLPDTAKFKDGRMIAVYLEQEFGGFAIHLLQK